MSVTDDQIAILAHFYSPMNQKIFVQSAIAALAKKMEKSVLKYLLGLAGKTSAINHTVAVIAGIRGLGSAI